MERLQKGTALLQQAYEVVAETKSIVTFISTNTAEKHYIITWHSATTTEEFRRVKTFKNKKSRPSNTACFQ